MTALGEMKAKEDMVRVVDAHYRNKGKSLVLDF